MKVKSTMACVFGHSVNSVDRIKNLLTDLLTFGIISIQILLWPKNNETLQIIDFARFLIRLEFPPSDLGRIQTCNLLSRNQMRYSVAPRGLFCGVQIYFFLHLPQNPRTDFNGF